MILDYGFWRGNWMILRGFLRIKILRLMSCRNVWVLWLLSGSSGRIICGVLL